MGNPSRRAHIVDELAAAPQQCVIFDAGDWLADQARMRTFDSAGWGVVSQVVVNASPNGKLRCVMRSQP